MTQTIADYAQRYIEDYGWHLVPIEPGRKYPTADDWGNTALSDPDAAREFYSNGAANWNMGLALGPSRMCSLDIDHEESFQTILAEYGLPAESLDAYPTIVGRGRRVMFRVPDGIELPYVKLNWPRQDDPKKHYTVIELRASCDGKQRQDVLPPSIHPGTGKPYVWSVAPPDPWQDWPEPPLVAAGDLDSLGVIQTPVRGRLPVDRETTAASVKASKGKGHQLA